MIAQLLSDLLGLTISDGQISRLQRIRRESLEPAYEEITADVRESAAVNIDETGWREDGLRAWLWTAVGRFSTRFAVRRSRSREVVHELPGEDFSGVVGADRYSAYAAIPEDRRQFCWAHLLRDFQAMIDRGGASEAIGRRLKTSGQELIHHWNRLCDEQTKRPTFDTHYRRLRSDIVKALGDGAVCTDTRTAETCRRLSNQCDSLFVFTCTTGVSPTNNAAERSLRRAVIFRKLSLGTESGSASETLAVVMSVLETCRRRRSPRSRLHHPSTSTTNQPFIHLSVPTRPMTTGTPHGFFLYRAATSETPRPGGNRSVWFVWPRGELRRPLDTVRSVSSSQSAAPELLGQFARLIRRISILRQRLTGVTAVRVLIADC